MTAKKRVPGIKNINDRIEKLEEALEQQTLDATPKVVLFDIHNLPQKIVDIWSAPVGKPQVGKRGIILLPNNNRMAEDYALPIIDDSTATGIDGSAIDFTLRPNADPAPGTGQIAPQTALEAETGTDDPTYPFEPQEPTAPVRAGTAPALEYNQDLDFSGDDGGEVIGDAIGGDEESDFELPPHLEAVPHLITYAAWQRRYMGTPQAADWEDPAIVAPDLYTPKQYMLWVEIREKAASPLNSGQVANS